jgi:hypothetical protein
MPDWMMLLLWRLVILDCLERRIAPHIAPVLPL